MTTLREWMMWLVWFMPAGWLMVPAHLAAQGPAGKKVALLVGVDHYDKPGLVDLSYCERDVQEVERALQELGFTTRLLLGSATRDRQANDPGAVPPNDCATRSNILKVAQELAEKLTKQDVMLVMLSGHGQQFPVEKDGQQGEDAFFCPVDAVSRNPETLVSLSELTDKILAPHVGRALLLVDACRNMPKNPNRGATKGIQGGDDIVLKAGQAVFFSCRAGQESREYPELKHGLFTYCLLEALRGEDGGPRDEVTWAGLVDHVSSRMAGDAIVAGLSRQDEQEPISSGSVAHTVLGQFNSRRRALRRKANMQPVQRGPKPPPLPLGFTPKQAEEAQRAWALYLGLAEPVVQTEKLKHPITLAIIPPGEFWMGTDETRAELQKSGIESDDDKRSFEEQRPRHAVRLTRPFAVGHFEIIGSQFAEFVAETRYKTDSERKGGSRIYEFGSSAKDGPASPNKRSWRNPGYLQSAEHPVIHISHNDAIAFVEWLSAREGQKYRLLTEAEWEYVCRAGTTTRYSTGDLPAQLRGRANLGDLALAEWFKSDSELWFPFNDRWPHTSPAGSFPPNVWGLFDLEGNVLEWCADWYAPDYYKRSPRDNPVNVTPTKEQAPGFPTTESVNRRVLRGGSWNAFRVYMGLVTNRSGLPPDGKDHDTGFRIARDLELPSE